MIQSRTICNDEVDNNLLTLFTINIQTFNTQ